MDASRRPFSSSPRRTAGARPLLLLFALTCALLIASGCSALPFFGGGPETTTVQIEGRPDMNSGGNAAVVHVYKLAGNSNFENTPLSTFWRDDEDALGDELVGKRQVQLFPEATESFEITIDPKTQFVGVAADLREPDREGWRKIYPVSKVADKKIDVTVASDRLTLDVTE